MKNRNKKLQKNKNPKSQGNLWSQAALFALAIILPAGASAQSVHAEEQIPLQQENESGIYQERYQRQFANPYQQQIFEQNQLSFGVPSSRRPTFDNFYAAEERAYRSREEERFQKEFELQMELMETELKQRQQGILLSQQANDWETYSENERGLDGSSETQPPIIVDNNNNTQVVIQLGKDNEKNLKQSGEDNELGLLQAGKNNKGSIDQQGDKNKGAIAQIGENNSANIRQSGSRNSATIDLGN